MNILFISLGCDKNLVDSESMLGLLCQAGYRLTDDETEADIILIEGLKNSGYPKYICDYPNRKPLSARELADQIMEAYDRNQ